MSSSKRRRQRKNLIAGSGCLRCEAGSKSGGIRGEQCDQKKGAQDSTVRVIKRVQASWDWQAGGQQTWSSEMPLEWGTGNTVRAPIVISWCISLHFLWYPPALFHCDINNPHRIRANGSCRDQVSCDGLPLSLYKVMPHIGPSIKHARIRRNEKKSMYKTKVNLEW